VAWRDKGDKERAPADFKTAVRLEPDLAIAIAHLKRIEQDIALSGLRSKNPLVPLHASSVPAGTPAASKYSSLSLHSRRLFDLSIQRRFNALLAETSPATHLCYASILPDRDGQLRQSVQFRGE
jgi:hypothetical protein